VKESLVSQVSRDSLLLVSLGEEKGGKEGRERVWETSIGKSRDSSYICERKSRVSRV
jgi:hypothetical protein